MTVLLVVDIGNTNISLGVFDYDDEPGKDDLVLNGISLDRLGDRSRLLTAFDRFRRDTDASGMMEGMDAFSQQAFGILTSSKLASALDINQERL